MTTIARLTELGMVPRVANEVIAQFAARAGDARRFQELSVATPLARELASQAGGAKNVGRLVESGMVPALAKEVVS